MKKNLELILYLIIFFYQFLFIIFIRDIPIETSDVCNLKTIGALCINIIITTLALIFFRFSFTSTKFKISDILTILFSLTLYIEFAMDWRAENCVLFYVLLAVNFILLVLFIPIGNSYKSFKKG